MSLRTHPVAKELEAASELRLHRLLADAEPVGDLGVAQLIDQPQLAHRGSFGGKLVEGSLDRGDELGGLQLGLDRRRRRRRPQADMRPTAGHCGALQPVACGVADRAVDVVPHGAGGDPIRPAAPGCQYLRYSASNAVLSPPRMRSAQARSAEVSDSLAKRFSRGIDGDRMRSEVLRVCVILRSRKIRTARSFELPICPEGGQLVFAELGRHWQTRLVQSLADLLPQAGAGVALMDLLEGHR